MMAATSRDAEQIAREQEGQAGVVRPRGSQRYQRQAALAIDLDPVPRVLDRVGLFGCSLAESV